MVGTQWGDEGKGKVVDVLTEQADLVVRYAGGANAGHTLVVDGQRLVVHLLPSGIVHPGKACLLGAGMVIDPAGLIEELEACTERGISVAPDRLAVSDRAHVILPYHKSLDALRDQGTRAIGTTRRGIGPCYEDKMGRRGIQMWQLLRPECLSAALDAALESTDRTLLALGGEKVDRKALELAIAGWATRLRPFVADTSARLSEALDAGAQVLFEGAQGALLDIDHGTYPFVTSSNTIAGGACTGAGVGPTAIHAVVGIAKAYQTRVGNGPFPTELTDATGERIRAAGAEYGATTGRPRRCGWLDAVTLRRAARLNGLTGLAVTKLDVLKGISPLRICVGYRLDGRPLHDLPPDAISRERIVPVFEDMEGFDEDLSDARAWDDLPRAARRYLKRVADLAGVPITLVSVGPERNDTILLDNPFDDE